MESAREKDLQEEIKSLRDIIKSLQEEIEFLRSGSPIPNHAATIKSQERKDDLYVRYFDYEG